MRGAPPNIIALFAPAPHIAGINEFFQRKWRGFFCPITKKKTLLELI
jgi:hypothetical protein